MEPPSKLMKTNSYLNFTLYYSSIVFFPKRHKRNYSKSIQQITKQIKQKEEKTTQKS